jgi:uncharacterized protein YPO0396
MTHSEALFQSPNGNEQQWRLESLLLCNWGGFDGIHEIDMSGLSTLISGVSGAGKSTVLDAWTTLLTPTMPLNAASNETGARTRGDGIRNTLTYVRGQYGVVDRSDREVPLVLRGANYPGPLDADPQDTWSAIAATFVSTAGIHYTFLRTFFAPREAVNPVDMKPQYAVFVGKLAIRHVRDYLEPAARDSELSKPALERLPGLSVLPVSGYNEELQRQLGIGAHGAGDKALKLLADIQRGKPVSRVSRLFQDLVLDRPITFEKADKVIQSFDGLDKMHTQMKDAEDQLRVLDGLDTDHAAMTAAMAEIAEIDTLGLTNPDRSRFLYWANQHKAGMYEEEAILADEQHAQAIEVLDTRAKRAERLEAELDAARTAYLQAGGGDAESVEARLKGLNDDRDRVEDTRRRFAEATRGLDVEVPHTVESFADAQQTAHRFLANYDTAAKEIKERRDAVQRIKWQLTDKIEEAERKIAALSKATGNIDPRLTAVRDRFAEAVGLSSRELPFVGELLDVHPDWEHWRVAADAELGGFANVLLLDEEIQSSFQEAINDLPDLRRRVSFRAIPVDLPNGDPPAEELLAGRLVVKEGPYAGWLRKHINSAYALRCIETADDFSPDDTPQITRTGQTKRGKRGAHGTGGRVIGFSNIAQRAELQADITQWRKDREPVEKQLGEFDGVERDLGNKRAAYEHVKNARWADLNLAEVGEAIANAEAELRHLLEDSNLDALKHHRDKLREQHREAERDHLRQQDAVEAAAQHIDAIAAERQRLAALLGDWAIDLDVIPTDGQVDDLNTRLGLLEDTTWDGSPEGFDNAVKTLQLILKQDLGTATTKRDSAAAQITARFREYQAHEGWHSDSRGDTLMDYEDYLTILNDLRDRGLHAQRRKWARAVIEWSGEDLSELVQSYRRAQDDIDDRLRPIREILTSVPFGRDGHTLDIEATHRSPAPVAAFLHELRTLASGAMEPNATDAQILDKFNAIRSVVDRIRNGKDERSALLDIRRHLAVKARAGGLVYDHIGDLSGGEGQMITAFIVGAALRYHLGDEKRNRPRFAPVVLDEAFIKADGEYTGSAVEAWRNLGFQLVVGAPEEKVNSLEAALDLSIVVTKNPEHYSYANPIPRKPSAG